MKRIAIFVLLIFTVIGLISCGNRDMIDTVFTFDRAIISLPTGEIVEGKVQKWRTYDDGDQVQVQIDGTIYLVHSSNIALIAD